ncbi:hypothetical protein CapIbe_017960 [Capra ibex]
MAAAKTVTRASSLVQGQITEQRTEESKESIPDTSQLITWRTLKVRGMNQSSAKSGPEKSAPWMHILAGNAWNVLCIQKHHHPPPPAILRSCPRGMLRGLGVPHPPLAATHIFPKLGSDHSSLASVAPHSLKDKGVPLSL